MKYVLVPLAVFAFFAAVTVVLAAPIVVLASHSCYSTWEDYNPEWGIMTNCRIEIDGKMVPVDNVRDVNLPK